MRKRITTTVTLSDEEGDHLPGNPVTLEESEADRILGLFGGKDLGPVEDGEPTGEGETGGQDPAASRRGRR